MKNDLVFNSRPCLSSLEIQQYIHSNLDKATQLSLENHMLDCPLCKDAVEGFSKTIKSKFETPKVYKNMVTFNRIAAATIPILLITSGYFYYKQNNAYQSLEKQLSHEITTDKLKNRGGEKPMVISENYAFGQQYFSNNKFEESVPYLEAALADLPQSTEVMMTLAKAYIKIGKSEKAISLLERIRLNDEELFDAADYYLATIFLQQNEKSVAAFYLKEIINLEKSSYQNKAKELYKTYI
ncbi:MAG: tetratricopeptide repeat protein, partial [Saprospiraceae bacterium]